MLCSELSLVKTQNDRIEIKPLPCNRWSCEYCQPARKRRLIAQAIGGNPTTFLTLTCNPLTENTPEAAARHLVLAWRKVRLAALRKYGYKSLPFFAVFEATKQGWPHIHIVCRVPWLDQKWLSAQMRKFNNAPIVDIRRVNSRRAVGRYLAKYIGKQPHQFGTCKRYWCSQNWEEITDEEREVLERNKGGWTVSRSSCWELRDLYMTQGYLIVETDNGWVGWKPTDRTRDGPPSPTAPVDL